MSSTTLSVALPEASSWSSAVSDLNREPNRRILIRDGCVISMDEAVGEFERADVLVEGDTIKQVGQRWLSDDQFADLTVIDAAGFIVMPGFVDTHRHMWQGQLRRMIPNVDISMYLGLRNSFAVQYLPEDSHIGTLAVALGALHSGVTTILDLAHNTRSAKHADAEVKALRDSGIRAVYACAPPEAGEWERHWPGDLARLTDLLADDPLVSLRMAQRCFSDVDNLNAERVSYARNLGLRMTIDPVAWDEGSAAITDLAAADLLAPDLTFVHCFDLSPAAWEAMGEAQVGVSLSPLVDEILGWGPEGLPTVQRSLDVGIAPALSVDIETTVPSDMFTQMRALLAVQRMRGSLGNLSVERAQLTAKDVLGYATREGARTVGLGELCGTLTPGKQADIVFLDTTAPNTLPLNNAYGTAVMGADVGNVTAVMVGGVLKKWAGSLVDVDVEDIHSRLTESRDRLASAVGFEIDLFTEYPTMDLGSNTLRMR